MSRPVWNGVISFGLLNVPVQLFTAVRGVDLHFRMLDSRDKKPIRYERVNAETGEEVPWKDIVKAFEYSKGNYVVVDEKEIRRVAPEATETVDIETFVDKSSIDPMYFEKPYYLVPGKKAEKGYVLLRETLRRTDKVAIARVVIRTRQYLAMMIPREDALVLNLLRFPQEIVPADTFAFPSGTLSKFRINATELRMAEELLKSMSGNWRPTDYKDEFRDKLRKLIQARVKKQDGKIVLKDESHESTTSNSATNVVDFMSLLKKSLATNKRTPAKASVTKVAKSTVKRSRKSSTAGKGTRSKRKQA